MPMSLRADHPALVDGRTIQLHTLTPAKYARRLLQPGNDKTGEWVIKGKWKGMPLLALTLPERATCPRTCYHWQDCYGNRMFRAKRIVPDESFLGRLDAELEHYNRVYARGFVVRLHILGDFFSVDYVNFWRHSLKKYPAMYVFGYTAWLPGTEIGDAIEALRYERFAVRFSNGGDRWGSANPAELGYKGITCPYNTGKTANCGTCGLCWTVVKNINFPVH